MPIQFTERSVTQVPVDAKGSPALETENAAKGSVLADEVLAKGSERCLSSLLAASSTAPSSRWELVLKPLMLLTGLLEPA